MRKTTRRNVQDYEEEYDDGYEEEYEPAEEELQEQPVGLFSTPGRVMALGLVVVMLVGVIVAVVFLLGNRNANAGAVSTGYAGTGTGSTYTAPKVGVPAPDFTLIDVQTNKPLKLSSFRGEKPVFVNFWGTWCPPCQAEMPEIQNTFNSYKDKVQFIGISMYPRDSPASVRQFVQQLKYGWTFVHDGDYSVAELYQVQAIPMSYFIGTDGIIKAENLGPMTGSQLKGYMDQLR